MANMPYALPAECPVCRGRFHVSRMKCQTCGAALEGEFELDRLSALSAKQRQFIVNFLKCRGNIREMEKTYAISYPTVRARLDEIVAELGEAPIGESGAGMDAGTGAGAGADAGAGAREDGGYDGESLQGKVLLARQLRRELLGKLARKEIDAQAAMVMIEQLEKLMENT
jgi:hypothetical protein